MAKETFNYRLPRIVIDQDLNEGAEIPLDEDVAHYLKNVLRRPDGAELRVFNGRDGEFIASTQTHSKKLTVMTIKKQIRIQPGVGHETHLVFALIKKDRQDFMIEKAVELGVTHFHPVLTQQTIIRDLNETRLQKQIREASEQCERLDIPQLLPLKKLESLAWPNDIPLYAGLERQDVPFLGSIDAPFKTGLLIGPEGGFSEQEHAFLLKDKTITPVSLGDTILRAETASIFGLSLIRSANIHKN